MDRSASQCTSGCESGWTLYLDQSTTLDQDQQYHGDYRPRGSLKLGFDQEAEHDDEEDDEEEDLSMVSDASSGPPFYHEDCYQDSFNGNGYHHFQASASAQTDTTMMMMKKKKKGKSMGMKQKHSNLDDTASSSVLSFSKRGMNFSNKKPSMENVSSQGFSATHFKEKSAGKKHFGFFKTDK